MYGLTFEPFRPAYQGAARQLIESNLAQRWGTLDPALNPDLLDIVAHYRPGWFLLAFHAQTLVGTGALLESEYGVQVVRMHTLRDSQGQGVGSAMLVELEQLAVREGVVELVLETTKTWHDAIAFYTKRGYEKTHATDDDAWFHKRLMPPVR
ncbi:MAG: GNAT family N-acetyltransferase [Pseudomonadota bacterium]